ncbi:protein of unknown function [Paraburkholderia dioscoreae]|uniref:Uncharacterized protein n=1 Tax=Paraburkholderia dioscoreae TaxID=2604047 RepID=A0A5Q4YV72_9BURK|nr:protein of unknown function [Paraburkholderia dioscoreae]
MASAGAGGHATMRSRKIPTALTSGVRRPLSGDDRFFLYGRFRSIHAVPAFARSFEEAASGHRLDRN